MCGKKMPLEPDNSDALLNSFPKQNRWDLIHRGEKSFFKAWGKEKKGILKKPRRQWWEKESYWSVGLVLKDMTVLGTRYTFCLAPKGISKQKALFYQRAPSTVLINSYTHLSPPLALLCGVSFPHTSIKLCTEVVPRSSHPSLAGPSTKLPESRLGVG